MTASESETIIRFDETDRLATIYTSSPLVANMLKRRGLKPGEVTVPPKDKETSWTFKVKKSSIIIKLIVATALRGSWEYMLMLRV